MPAEFAPLIPKLSTEDAARYLGVTAQWLRRLRQTGRGPRYMKVGRVVRYDPPDLDAFARRDRRTSTQDKATFLA